MSKDVAKLFVAVAAVVIVTVLLTVFFKTSLGLSIRATGDNADMSVHLPINVDAVKMVALSISNCMHRFLRRSDCSVSEFCGYQLRRRYPCCRSGFRYYW